jgi:putative oxidoreductase
MTAAGRSMSEDVSARYARRDVPSERPWSQAARYGPPLGRLLLAIIFLVSGVAKIADFGGSLQYMVQHGMPLPQLLLIGAIIVEVAGGLSLLLGYQTRWGAVLLALFLIPVTLVFHAFWQYTGMEATTQMANFLKNVAIMGGLVYVASFGPGAIAADQRPRVRKRVRKSDPGRPAVPRAAAGLGI